jgi:hypothetical protein
MLKNFKEIFGPNFKNNIGFIFTHWGLGEEEVEERKDNKITKEVKIEEINKELIKLNIIGANDSSIKCFFIDNR